MFDLGASLSLLFTTEDTEDTEVHRGDSPPDTPLCSSVSSVPLWFPRFYLPTAFIRASAPPTTGSSTQLPSRSSVSSVPGEGHSVKS